MDAILAVNKVNSIGLDGGLPWRCSDDLKHFKKLTLGKNLLVGRKTFDTLPPLKDRNIFVASQNGLSIDEILCNNTIDFVIGGAEIFNKTLHLCDKIHVSIINDRTIGDTYLIIPNELKDRCIFYNFETNK